MTALMQQKYIFQILWMDYVYVSIMEFCYRTKYTWQEMVSELAKLDDLNKPDWEYADELGLLYKNVTERPRKTFGREGKIISIKPKNQIIFSKFLRHPDFMRKRSDDEEIEV